MKIPYLLIITLVIASIIGHPVAHAAQAGFTAEQRAEIDRMISDALAKQRAQVRAEVVAEMHAAQEKKEPAATSRVQEPPANLLRTESPGANAQTPQNAQFTPVGLNSVLDREVSESPSNFQISGGTDDTSASIRLASEKSYMEGSTGIFSTTAWTMSAPLDKGGQGYTNIATLDGLSNGFRLAFNYSKFITTEFRNPAQDDGTFTPAYLALCGDAGIDTKKSPEKCTRGAIQRGLENAGLQNRIRDLDAQFEGPRAWRWSYGYKASVGRDSFDYFVPTALTKATAIREPWGVGTFVSFVPPGHESLFSASLEFQRSYKAAKSKVNCPASDGSAAVECVNGSIGGPQNKDKHLVALEYRSVMLDKGYSVRLTHDFRNDETGVDVPIYLVQDSAGKLNGGLRLGWTNTDKFTFGVFVGSAFGIY